MDKKKDKSKKQEEGKGQQQKSSHKSKKKGSKESQPQVSALQEGSSEHKTPKPSQQLPQEQGDGGSRSFTPTDQQLPTQQQGPQQQGAWGTGGSTPTHKQRPTQQQGPQQQGAWRSGSSTPTDQQLPTQQQGAWGSRGSTPTHKQRPTQQQGPQQQGAWRSGGSTPTDQQLPMQQQGPQQQGAWRSRGSTPTDQQLPMQQQGPQQQGAWRSGGSTPTDQQLPTQQQGAWGSRGSTPTHKQRPTQQQGPQQQGAWRSGGSTPTDQQLPMQQQGPQQQGAWGSRGSTPTDQQLPMQQQGPQQQGAWRSGGSTPTDQQLPTQQQGAWGSRGSTPTHKQRPTQQQGPQQQGAWRSGGSTPPDQQLPMQQQGPQPQGAWRSGGSTPTDQQLPMQQQGPQQQGAWGSRGSTPTHKQRPTQKQGEGGSIRSTPTHEQRPSQGQGDGPQKQGIASQPKSGSTQEAFEFAPRIFAQKMSGRPIVVATNFFRLIIENPNLILYNYNVVIEPDKPKFLLRAVWNKFVSIMFPNRLTAFNGRNAFSKGPLTDDENCRATVTVLNPDSNREKEFSVSINKVGTISFNCFLNYREKVLKEKNMKVLPEAEISVLEIILKEWGCNNFVSTRRQLFPPSRINPESVKLSDKLDLKFGYFQSVFMGYIPYLNFDIAHKPFYRSASMLDILESFRQRHTQSLNVDDFNSFIRSAKVEYQLPNDPQSRKAYRVNKLVNNANTQTFEKDGTKITVAQYFATEKKCTLQYPDLPLLWVGPTQKSIYLPLEFCRLLPDQIYQGLMDSWETREMVKNATTNAVTRFNQVNEMFKRVKINDQPLMKEFGLSVSSEMERVPARVLAPPELRTSGTIRVNEGVWRIRDFLEPVTLNRWCILNADRQVRRESVMQLQNMIKTKGKDFNMQIGDPRRDPMNVDPSFAGLKKAFSNLKDMDMVFVIISEAKGLYSKVKTICETQEGILTQCVKSKTVSQDPRKLSTTLENILLKVNAKLGGKNHTLNKNSIPECLNGYVMVVGADVTHAGPGTKIPSVAAVAVSCDAAAFQYAITTRVQAKGEMIVDLQEIMTIHLRRFKEIRQKYPEKIIFFRDGVSEGELPKVFKSELMAVKNACSKFCQPKITFVVVQKRHHARFFPTRREDEQGKNFNVPVGTCVDSHVVHPRDLDFYLVSHASILGTARPTRYRLLYDDSQLTDDEMEKLTYYLCHLFSRCNRSVSYPSPTYNAHLGAFRARAYLEGLNVTNDQDLVTTQRKMTDNISNISPMFFV